MTGFWPRLAFVFIITMTAKNTCSFLHEIHSRKISRWMIDTIKTRDLRTHSSIHTTFFSSCNKRRISNQPFPNPPRRLYDTLAKLKSTSDAIDSGYKEDTIYALSSGGGGSSATAVAVIRITGPESHEALKVLLSKSQSSYENVKLPKARYASLRMLYDPNASYLPKTTVENSDDELSQEEYTRIRDPLDSSLVLLFQSPSSFTGQDMVEIHTHGSRAVVQGVLSALNKLSEGPFNLSIRPAEKGEFTQRAYSSGKLGLLEVEALADLIVADTSSQRLQALRQMDGRLSNLYEGWRKELIKGLAHAEAVIDFGDDEDLQEGYDSDEMNVWGGIKPRMEKLRNKMLRHLSDSQRGEILRDGVKIAICGPPNAGKSSLLNLIAAREAAIVSPVAGTTRDVVEVIIDLDGVKCVLSDTAGVRKEGSTSDIIEVEGIKRAKSVASEAHILICMVDATDVSSGMSTIKEVIGEGQNQKILFLQNKIDLIGAAGTSSDISSKKHAFSSELESFEISCEKNIGIEEFIATLTGKVRSRVEGGEGMHSASSVENEGAIITRARHRRHALAASNALSRFIEQSDEGYMALDLAAEELRCASSELGRITGAVDVEDVLDVLFSDFCIGK